MSLQGRHLADTLSLQLIAIVTGDTEAQHYTQPHQYQTEAPHQDEQRQQQEEQRQQQQQQPSSAWQSGEQPSLFRLQPSLGQSSQERSKSAGGQPGQRPAAELFNSWHGVAGGKLTAQRSPLPLLQHGVQGGTGGAGGGAREQGSPPAQQVYSAVVPQPIRQDGAGERPWQGGRALAGGEGRAGGAGEGAGSTKALPHALFPHRRKQHFSPCKVVPFIQRLF